MSDEPLFPDPRHIPSDIVAMGGSLSSDRLVQAYQRGIFPWPVEGLPLPWFSPRRRAILRFEQLHRSRSLRTFLRRTPLVCTMDRAFARVIAHCATIERPEQEGTWITPEIERAYVDLHSRGYAHSVEVWEGDVLVGGVYGVDPGGAFTGESMFHLRPNASKLALLHLIDHLRARGLEWLDVQIMTPHLKALGARLIGRNQFLDMLARERSTGRILFD